MTKRKRKRKKKKFVRMDTFWGEEQRIVSKWVTKVCPFCGESFITENLDQRCCSTPCAFGTAPARERF